MSWVQIISTIMSFEPGIRDLITAVIAAIHHGDVATVEALRSEVKEPADLMAYDALVIAAQTAHAKQVLASAATT